MTTAIWRITRSLSRMELAEKSNDSAQSPAWRSTARPSATLANEADSARASPAKTSGGGRRRRARALSNAVAAGHSGCWAAGPGRHEPREHTGLAVAARSREGPRGFRELEAAGR